MPDVEEAHITLDLWGRNAARLHNLVSHNVPDVGGGGGGGGCDDAASCSGDSVVSSTVSWQYRRRLLWKIG